MAKKKIGLDSPAEDIPGPPQMPGGLPLPVGQPVRVEPKSLTQKERQDLEAIGWKPGMPIPSNLADLVEQVTKEATDTEALPPPVDPSTPPIRAPKPVDLQDLPEEKKEVLRQALEEAARQQAQPQPAMPQQPGEGVVEAIQAAQGIGGREIVIENDLDRPKEQAAKPKPEPTPVAEEPEPTPPPATTESAPQTEGACPYCGWDLSIHDVIEVTEEDKDLFTAAMVGGQVFQKTYSLFGGRMRVTFRSLYSYEIDACFAQAYADHQAGKTATLTDRAENLQRYYLALQLVEIQSDQEFLQMPKSLKEWGWAPNQQGVLPQIRDKVYQEVLKTESRVRVISGALMNFRRLYARLEANAERPDFYAAAGPAR